MIPVKKDKNSNTKAIIFDLFATLTIGKANPEAKIISEFNLKQEYYSVEAAITYSKKFKDMNSYIRNIIKNLNLEDTTLTREKILKIFKEDVAGESLRKEAPEILMYLKSKGYKLGLISNIPNPWYKILEKSKINQYFDVISYSYELDLLKPNPEIFRHTLKKLNVSAKEAVMIGDSMRNDLMPASSLGMHTYLLDVNSKHLDHPSRLNSLEAIRQYL